MQDRYAGDIGDYVKLALLRHLGDGQKLGIAWYLYPNEEHNADGRHVSYLSDAKKWRTLDPDLFDALKQIVKSKRSVDALEQAGILEAKFAGEPIVSHQLQAGERSAWRSGWFSGVLAKLSGCDLIFADPDNGLIGDCASRRKQKKFGKQLPLSEAVALSQGRTAVIYHHNTRRKGGHDVEIDHWLGLLARSALAIRATAFSARTFFIVNPEPFLCKRMTEFCDIWSEHKVRLHERQPRRRVHSSQPVRRPQR